MPAGPGSDDADAVSVRLDMRQVGPALGDGSVADEAFQPADRHRFERLADRAAALALGFLRADAAAHRGQQVGAADRVVRAAEILRADAVDEAGNVDADRDSRRCRPDRDTSGSARPRAAPRLRCSRSSLQQNYAPARPDPVREPGCAAAGSCGLSVSSPLPFTKPLELEARGIRALPNPSWRATARHPRLRRVQHRTSCRPRPAFARSKLFVGMTVSVTAGTMEMGRAAT